MRVGLRCFSASAITSFLICSPSIGDAYTKLRRVSAADCLVSGNVYFIDYGVKVTQHVADIACPFNDEYGVFLKTDVNTLEVYTYDGDDDAELIARACVNYASTLGAQCGSSTSTGYAATGNVTLTPSVSVWDSNPSNFAYLWVRGFQEDQMPYELNLWVKGYKAYD